MVGVHKVAGKSRDNKYDYKQRLKGISGRDKCKKKEIKNNNHNTQ